MNQSLLDAETLDVSIARGGEAAAQRVVTLTLAHHADPARIGERARSAALGHPGGRLEVGRAEPLFKGHGAAPAMPLLSPFVSRKPLVIEGRGGGAVRLDASGTNTRVEVDGALLTGVLDLGAAELERGVVLQLGSHLVLILHLENPDEGRPEASAGDPLVGDTDAMRGLRGAIARVAADARPVLLRGETGTGKELVAAALHAASPRRAGRYVAVNMAAVPATLAASELFGHARGAFSGADAARDGHFVRADGGTLFLDEIGDTPMEVQAALLRALETGEVTPLGGRAPTTVDVRVVAATDSDLDRDIAEGRFRAPLYFRLAANEIRLPPLRERRPDVARLLVHFLQTGLAEAGRGHLLRPALTEAAPWLTADLVARLCRYDWPGNVRQLRSVCHALVLGSGQAGGLPAAELDRLMPGRGASASAHPAAAASAPPTPSASSAARRPPPHRRGHGPGEGREGLNRVAQPPRRRSSSARSRAISASAAARAADSAAARSDSAVARSASAVARSASAAARASASSRSASACWARSRASFSESDSSAFSSRVRGTMPRPSYQRGCPSRRPNSMPSERTGQRPFCGMMRVYVRSVLFARCQPWSTTRRASNMKYSWMPRRAYRATFSSASFRRRPP
jgi:DNA-binding NtrC family response regulator